MAESSSDFTLTIPVELDFSTARQQARAELGAIARGGAPTAPGGQGAALGPSYSAGVTAAEQAAVDRAMAMAQERSARMGGGYNAGAGAASVGGFSGSARLDTVQAETGLRRVQSLWQALKAEIEGSPIRMGIASGAMPQAGGVASALPMALPVQSVMGIPVSGPGGANNLPVIAAAAEARAASQAARTGGSLGVRFGGGRRGFAGYGKGSLLIEEVLGADRAGHAIRNADLMAQGGETPEERQEMRSKGLYEASESSLILRGFNWLPNLLDLEYSPERIAREGAAGAMARRMNDAVRKQKLALSIGPVARAGRAKEGEYGLKQWTIAAERDAELAEMEDRAVELRTRLGEYYPDSGNYVLPKGSEVRSAVQSQLNAIEAAKGEALARADDALKQNRADKDDALAAFEIRQSRSTAVMSGANDRALRIKDIEGEARLRRLQLQSQYGRDMGGKLSDALLGGEYGEEEYNFQHKRREVNEDIQQAIRQTRYRKMGPAGRLDSAFDDVTTSTNREARELEEAGMSQEAAWRRRLGRIQLSGVRDDYLRSFQYQEGSLTRMAGTFDMGDVDKKLRDAQGQMDQDAQNKNGAGLNLAELKMSIRDIVGLLTTIATGYKPARVK